jgi:hypothetical protein
MMSLLPGHLLEIFVASRTMNYAHLEASIEVRHFLGILSLRGSDKPLHLLSLGLDIFPQCNEAINCGLERANKWLRIES